MSEITSEPRIKVIELKKFYFIHDGSKTGHPGYVIAKDDAANRYLIVRFDSDKKGDVPKKARGIRHITELSHPIESKVVTSYVKNRPLLCKRRDIGKELLGLTISSVDLLIIEKVALNVPQVSKSIKK